MSPELQKVVNEALVVVIPAMVSIFVAFATWVVKRLNKARRDSNALNDYRRLILEELGIDPKETEWNRKTRRINVTRTTSGLGSQTRSGSPQLLSNEGSGQPDHEAGTSNEGKALP